jgi:hypothetical protein
MNTHFNGPEPSAAQTVLIGIIHLVIVAFKNARICLSAINKNSPLIVLSFTYELSLMIHT